MIRGCNITGDAWKYLRTAHKPAQVGPALIPGPGSAQRGALPPPAIPDPRPAPKVFNLVTAARRAPRRGEGGFLDDFFDLHTTQWTIRANYRLSFLIGHPDTCIRVSRVARDLWAPPQVREDRKMHQNTPKPPNRPLRVSPAELFLDALSY